LRFRRTELLFAAYFIYVSVVAAFRPVPPSTKYLIWGLNISLFFWMGIFAWANKDRGFRVLDYVRDWYPFPLILLAYREMGWLALPHKSTAFEDYWIRWDRWLFYDLHLKQAIEWIPPLPSILELAYLLVYAVPCVLIVVFYTSHQRERLDDAYSVQILGTLMAYALYPYFPSEPPRAVFPGQDLPDLTAPLRTLNLYLVGNYGIHTSVFPSGHSAAAFSAAFAAIFYLKGKAWVGRALLALAILIAVGSWYGRYHYAIDAVAGLGVALMALAVSFLWRTGSAKELQR
jgi:membrane-associated phospholipid phosphatase